MSDFDSNIQSISSAIDALTTERDQLRAELIKVLRFVDGQATPDVSTAFLLNVSEEVSAWMGEMAGETADLRAEVERLQLEAADAESHVHVTVAKLTKATARAEAAEKESLEYIDYRNQAVISRNAMEIQLRAAESTVAGLRRVLEEIAEEGNDNPYAVHSQCRDPRDTGDARDYAKWELGEIARAALAASPAEHERRIKAEALRELKGMAARKVDGCYVVFWNHIEAEADRLEATDATR